jgi:hypothetical protein
LDKWINCGWLYFSTFGEKKQNKKNNILIFNQDNTIYRDVAASHWTQGSFKKVTFIYE